MPITKFNTTVQKHFLNKLNSKFKTFSKCSQRRILNMSNMLLQLEYSNLPSRYFASWVRNLHRVQSAYLGGRLLHFLIYFKYNTKLNKYYVY